MNEFCTNFPDSPIQSHTSLWRIMKGFEETGCVVVWWTDQEVVDLNINDYRKHGKSYSRIH